MNKFLCIDNFYVNGKLECLAGRYYPIEFADGDDEGYVTIYNTESSENVWATCLDLGDCFEEFRGVFMKQIENLKTYTQEDLRKDIVKALFGDNAVLGIDYVDFHYELENDAGLVVKFRDKESPFATKTFIIRIEDAANKEVVKEEI